jgi:chitinase
MSYDLMNRRDNVTAHHTSVTGAAECIENYIKIGAPVEKINLGFAFYAKYFTTAGRCTTPLGCPIVAAEDPVTGQDRLTSGAWTFEPEHMVAPDMTKVVTSYDGTCGPQKMTKCTSGCCSQYGNCGTSAAHCSGACQHAFGTGCLDTDVAGSWQIAQAKSVTDKVAGGQYYLDQTNSLFWTWDTPELITRKFQDIVQQYGIGGVMAWSLGEDSYDWSHIHQIAKNLKQRGYGTPVPKPVNQEYDVVMNDGGEPTATVTTEAAESAEPTEYADYSGPSEDDGWYWVNVPEDTTEEANGGWYKRE